MLVVFHNFQAGIGIDLLFELIVTRYEINKSPKCTRFCKKIVRKRICFWGSAPDPAGGAYDAPPDPLVVKGFLPSAIAAPRLQRLQFPILGNSGS